MLEVRPASLRDVPAAAANLRPEDVQEIRSIAGKDRNLEEVVAFNLAASTRAYSAWTDDGRFVCIGGVAPAGNGAGSVWMHGSTEMEKHRITLLKMTPACVNLLHEDYDLLFNHVDARNDLHVQWLRYAGFRFLRPSRTYAADGSLFVEFFKQKDSNV